MIDYPIMMHLVDKTTVFIDGANTLFSPDL